MPTSLSVTVRGIPRPQGSKRAFVVKGKDGGNARAVVVDARKGNLADWRGDVKSAVLDAMPYDWQRIEKPSGVGVELRFRFDRPTSDYGSGRNSSILKATANRHHVKAPDVDKLARAVLDSLTATGVYADDSQVVLLTAHKRYCHLGEHPGVDILVMPDAATDSAVPSTSGEAGAGTADTTHDDPPLF